MIKKIIVWIVYMCSTVCSLYAQEYLKLWYDKPAQVWTEALPVGNGRLGAMIFGKVNEEII